MKPHFRTASPNGSRRGHARRAVALLGALVLLAACNGDEEEADSAESGAPPPPLVVVQEAAPGERMTREISLPGRVEAVTQAELSFLVDGQLEAILVAEGEIVAAGQEIARLDDTDYQVELRQAQTTEETASADLARRRVLNRDGILARAMVEEAEANVAQARAQREGAERQVFYTRLTAPYAGQIGRRLQEVGATVSAGMPVVTMVDGAAIDVAVDLPATEAVRLPFGPELTGTGILQGVGRAVEMELDYVEHSTVPDEESRTYRLVLRGLPPPDLNILPGMAVRVVLPDPEPVELPEGELLVPASAVYSMPDGRSAIFVVAQEDRVVQAPVELLSMEGERALVRGDFDGGARVVVAGAQHLSDGQAVRPMVRD